MEEPEVAHPECLAHLLLEQSDVITVCSRDHQIVDVHADDELARRRCA